ncbi:hypothetical protein H9P43_003745 [Blastocladiella emersonii ATCC 22665]|nr:hypothetical protein H9P43_003745 [Blastocladiella emersonii ATCC 22665]
MPGTELPVIAVVGSTGTQGGSVVASLLRSGNWKVRALTRNPQSERARDLASKGAQVIRCDVDIPADLNAAFAGAKAVFAVTNFWEPANLARGDLDFEVRQGQKMADAAKEAGVEHFIWSSLPNAAKLTENKLNCHQFTSKGRVEEYIREIGLPSTFIYTGLYMSNIQSHFAPARLADGSFEWSTAVDPEVGIPLSDPENDMGLLVAKVLARNEPKGQRIPLASEVLTFPQIVSDFSRVSGLRAIYKYRPITSEQRSAAKNNPTQKSWYDMLDMINEKGYWCGVDQTPEWAVVEGNWTSWVEFLRKSTLRLES